MATKVIITPSDNNKLTITPNTTTITATSNTTTLTISSAIPSGDAAALTDFSVTTATASGNGSLTYDNAGVFTFTPANVEGRFATEADILAFAIALG